MEKKGFKAEKQQKQPASIHKCHILYQIWPSASREIRNVILNKRVSASDGYLCIWLKIKIETISK